MKRSFVQQMLADYPDWHDKPFQLSSAEIEDPYMVLEEFFQRYSLDNLRTELKELLTDALNGGMIDDPSMYVGICENMEKLSEACYVLYKRETERSDFLNEDEVPLLIPEEKEGSIPEDIEDDEEGNWGITRPALLLEVAQHDPLKGIHRTFQVAELQMLDRSLEGWLHIALCNEYGGYDHGVLRGRLITYVKELRRLFEALFVLRETEEVKRYTGADHLSPGLFKDIRNIPQIQFLSLEELHTPMNVVVGFFEQFSYRYARLELWDLLEAVNSYDGEDPPPPYRLNLLLEYDCMAALLLAAKLLSVKSGDTLSTNQTSEHDADDQ